MRILDKYILKEYLKPVFYCLFAFCMIFVLWDMMGHLSKFITAKAPAYLVAKFYIFVLAPAMVMLAPASLLLSTLYTLWQFTRSNQLTAMRSSGISLFRIMYPFILSGVTASILVGIINEYAITRMSPWADEFRRNKYHLVESNVVENHAFFARKPLRQWIISSMDLKKPDVLNGVSITQERPDHTKVWSLSATTARWMDGQWWLFNISMRHYSEHGTPLGKDEIFIPGSELGKPFHELTETADDIVREARPWQYFSALEMWRYLDANRTLSSMTKAEKRYDFHSRLAMPWACLVVTLFGIPMGTKTSRQSMLNGILLAIALLMGFYLLSQIGLLLGKQKHVAPWLGAWLSNLVFLVVGIVMSSRQR